MSISRLLVSSSLRLQKLIGCHLDTIDVLSGGPIHTSLAQRARYGNDDTLEG